MTTSYAAETGDQALIEQFIRLFGYRPTAEQLESYRHARARLDVHLPARIRRSAARLITRA